MYTKEIERHGGIKIKVVEYAGFSLKRTLQRSNPFKNKYCDREDCFVCISGGKGPCDAEGITYNIVCTECDHENEGKGMSYIRETARNACSRGKEHLKSLRNKEDISED